MYKEFQGILNEIAMFCTITNSCESKEKVSLHIKINMKYIPIRATT